MTHDGTGLHDYAGYWLRRLSEEVQTGFERRLAARGVTVAQWNVLITVHHGDATTTSGVARFIGIDPGAVSRLADRLVEKGLLIRRQDSVSRRQIHLDLTSEGARLMPDLIALGDENDAVFFGALAPRARAGLVRLLRRLLVTTPAGGRSSPRA